MQCVLSIETYEDKTKSINKFHFFVEERQVKKMTQLAFPVLLQYLFLCSSHQPSNIIRSHRYYVKYNYDKNNLGGDNNKF